MAVELPPELITLAAAQDGVFTRAQALSAGLSAKEFQQGVASRQWHRIRRGRYVAAEVWRDAGSPTRQRLSLRAMSLRADGLVVGSHETAAAVLGLELWEPAYEWVHLTRPGHSARREAGVWHHDASLQPAELVTVAGLTVTSAIRTALDVARRSDFEHGLVAVDSALRLGPASVDELREAHLRCVDWPGARTAGRAVSHADGRCGSVGESRVRANLAIAGIPEPISQVSVYDEARNLIGIVDFLLDGKVILEFDGQVKYRLNGLTPAALAEQLWREKRREDALRRLGYELERITWGDLYTFARIVTRVRAAQARAASTPPVRGFHVAAPLRSAPYADSSRRA